MGKKPRTKMPVSQRAKQFAPFKSLDGLDDVIRRAEEEHRREIESSGVVHVADETADMIYDEDEGHE
jgi:hypothetical protein